MPLARVVAFGVSRETIALLRHLLALAIKGHLRGLALCYWHQDIGHQVGLTGVYNDQPDRALAGADLIKIAAANQLDLFR
jgi:hypothetical protein